MGKIFDALDEQLCDWISQQQMFFVASAALAADTLINCSPKGIDSFRVIDAQRVAYLDLVGSGAETIAHVRENGRLCIMFCAFEGAPKILRLQGQAQIHLPDSEAYADLRVHFADVPGARSIIELQVQRIADSCGFGVPQYSYQGQREQLTKWAAKQGPEKLRSYQAEHNQRSIDGLPALDS